MTDKILNNPRRFIRMHELANICGLSRSTIRMLELCGKFPKRVKLSDKAIAWDYEEIMAWCEKRKNTRK